MNEFSLHTTCDTVTISMFIKCYVDADYSVLTISGNPSKEALATAWDMVQSHYAEIGKSMSPITKTAMLFMEINSMEIRYISIIKACEFLKINHDRLISDMLVNEGYAFPFDPNNRDQYFKDISRVEKRVKSMLVQIKHKTSELEKLMEEDGPMKKMSREDFLKELSSLGKFLGYRVDPEVVTMSEFVANKWLFYEHLKHMSKNHGRVNQ